jgi:hypothetical protein
MTSPNGRLPIANAYQMSIRYSHSGQESVNVIGYMHDEGGVVPQAGHQAVIDTWWSALRPVLHDELTILGGTWRQTVTDGVTGEVTAPVSPNGGLNGGVALPAYSFLINLATTQGGRSGRGRVYLPGVASVDVAPGGRAFLAAKRTAVNEALATLKTNMDSLVGVEWSVLSFTKGQAYEVSAATLAGIPGIQRRRMRG